MPGFNLQNIMQITELFKSKAVAVEENHCVAVRNRNAKCQRCVQACIVDAISVSSNKIDIDADACMSCGACIAACPTSAIVGLDPGDKDIAAKISKAISLTKGMAVITCARMASRQVADPEKYASLPCLARLDESLLVSLAAGGIDDIVLVDGNCKTCKYGAVSSQIDDTVQSAIDLLEMRGSSAIISRVSEFPPEILIKSESQAAGLSRRSAFTSTGGYAKNVVSNAADMVMTEFFHQNSADNASSSTAGLRVGKNGKMPVFQSDRHMRILDDLYNMGNIVRDEFNTRLFGVLSIDSAKCSGCGMCVMFCPTEAIKYADFDEPDDESMRFLEFQIADCTQCRLCADVCLRRCLEVSSLIPTEELFDFEPRFIEIPRPTKSNYMFGNRH